MSNRVASLYGACMLPENLFNLVFQNGPIGSYLLSATPDVTILAVNDSFLQTVSRSRDELVGKRLFEVFPKNPNDADDTGVEALRRSIIQAIMTGETQVLPAQRYPIRKTLPNGEKIFEERFWNATNTPIFDESGALICIYHTTIEVTKEVRAQMALCQSEERFRSLVIASSQVVWTAVPSGEHLIDFSSWKAFTGQCLEESQNYRWLEAVHPDDRLHTLHSWQTSVSKQCIFSVEYRLRRFDGEFRWMAVKALPLINCDGNIREWVGTNTDITEQKRATEELYIANQRLNLALEGIGEGFWEWDIKKGKLKLPDQFKRNIGYEGDELSDASARWLSLIHPDDRPRMHVTMDKHLTGNTASYCCEYRVQCKDGSWRWMYSRGVLIEQSPEGEPVRVVGVISDISARKEADERVWHFANFDILTSLPNRRLFRERLNHEIVAVHRRASTIALLFIDLDRFKQVNDLMGHDAGDTLLVQAAQRITECVRDSDTVARLGGDEFTIILSDLHQVAHVEDIVQKVLDALAIPFVIGNEEAYLSGSIGIAVYPQDAQTPEELIRKADQAMYAAKHAGKNQFSYFTKEMDEKAHMRLRLIQEMRRAIPLGQMQVHYQPVVELQGGHIVKAEALARWEHPLFGYVSPAEFIPLAEEAGMINEIGDYVFKEAATLIKRWHSEVGMHLQVSINKSPLQFGTRERDQWLDYLEQLQLSPKCVSVEITEGVLLDIADNISVKLLEYRDAGIQVAIDDFGTGYSSMAYLQKFDIDYLKIDKSFVNDIADNPNNRAIAESMIVMAHRLGLKVIAEGVETDEQMEILKEAGCDYGQGFLFSQPVSANEFEKLFLKANHAYTEKSVH